MADDPKPQTPPAGAKPLGANDQKPADTGAPKPGANDQKPADNGAKPPAPGTGNLAPDALADGTKPTILAPGESHRPVAKGKASLGTIYRKADVMTTLFTFGGAIVAAALILGGYVFFTRGQAGKPAAPPGKVTTLSQSDLSKLGAFFSGNSAGGSGQILTISASSLFNGRVAVNSDLKVTGALDVSGGSTLGTLNVNQTSTLGVTNVRGSLTVDGPTIIQSPAVLSGGASVKGNLTTSGNGSFGGSVSAGVINATTISVGTVNLSGHLSITGGAPTASGTGFGTSASVTGNDTAGTVTVTASCSSSCSGGGLLAVVHFHTAYPRDPTIIITPVGAAAARLLPYIAPGASSFTIGAGTMTVSGATSYSFNYWIVQ